MTPDEELIFDLRRFARMELLAEEQEGMTPKTTYEEALRLGVISEDEYQERFRT